MADPDKGEAIHMLGLLLKGTLEARERVLLKMNVPALKKEDVLGILPALKEPTISELVGGGYFAIEAVVFRKGVNSLIYQLLKEGAEDVIQLSISKVIRSW